MKRLQKGEILGSFQNSSAAFNHTLISRQSSYWLPELAHEGKVRRIQHYPCQLSPNPKRRPRLLETDMSSSEMSQNMEQMALTRSTMSKRSTPL
jgi:hypothetical protein